MPSSITEIEKSLWEAADQLRANSKLTATEYSMPVPGLIFASDERLGDFQYCEDEPKDKDLVFDTYTANLINIGVNGLN